MLASARVPEDGRGPAGPGPLARPLEVRGQGGTYVGSMGLKLAQAPHHPNRSRPWGPPRGKLVAREGVSIALRHVAPRIVRGGLELGWTALVGGACGVG